MINFHKLCLAIDFYTFINEIKIMEAPDGNSLGMYEAEHIDSNEMRPSSVVEYYEMVEEGKRAVRMEKIEKRKREGKRVSGEGGALCGHICAMSFNSLLTAITFSCPIVSTVYFGWTYTRAVLLLIFLYGVFCYGSSYFKAIFTSPGYAPKAMDVAPAKREEEIHSYEAPYDDNDDIVEKNYCETCNRLRVERAYHCKICKGCILKRDHHCPWIGSCVGFHNFGYFIRFLMFGFICSCMSFATFIYAFIKIFFFDINIQTYTIVLFPLGFVFILISCLLTFVMFTTSIASVLSNETMIEKQLNQEYRTFYGITYKGFQRPYDYGKKFNMQQVFGANWKIALFTPAKITPIGNGVSFEPPGVDRPARFRSSVRPGLLPEQYRMKMKTRRKRQQVLTYSGAIYLGVDPVQPVDLNNTQN